MLMLTRRCGEAILIGYGPDAVTVRFRHRTWQAGLQVPVEVTAPADVQVHRAEALDRELSPAPMDARRPQPDADRTSLVLDRCRRETVVIGRPPDAITITINDIMPRNDGYSVRVAIAAPRAIPVDREEVRAMKEQTGFMAGRSNACSLQTLRS